MDQNVLSPVASEPSADPGASRDTSTGTRNPVLAHDFPLPGSIAGHNSQSSKQIVQNLVRDGRTLVMKKRTLSPAKPIPCPAGDLAIVGRSEILTLLTFRWFPTTRSPVFVQ